MPWHDEVRSAFGFSNDYTSTHKTVDFIDNDDSAIMFFHFIPHQYFRTKRIREAIGEVLSQISPDHDFAHLKNIACYIIAVNLGASLFKYRNRVDFIFLDNRNALKFITGDQPVVNLMSTGDSNETEVVPKN